METIKLGKYVELTYSLFAGVGEKEETLMMKASEEVPDAFVYGVDNEMLPALVKALDGKVQGDSFDIVLLANEAFGDRDENYVVDLDKAVFEVDGKFDDKVIFEGNVVPMMTAEGYRIQGQVIKIAPDKVTLDFNHPLAGENIRYKGEVRIVRDATEEELHPKHSCGCGCSDCGDGCGDGCGDEGCGCGDHDHEGGCGCEGGCK